MASAPEILTEAQARAIIAPWYSLFSVATRGDVSAIAERALTDDYQSCYGNQPGECWGRAATIEKIAGFAELIPDMEFRIVEVLVAADRVIVRGEQTGTPAGVLFGIPHSGKRFRIMAFDIQTLRGGRIARTYHVEDWHRAAEQLRAT
jgi:predicted ester cyclase